MIVDNENDKDNTLYCSTISISCTHIRTNFHRMFSY